jgi:hypothetical protein
MAVYKYIFKKKLSKLHNNKFRVYKCSLKESLFGGEKIFVSIFLCFVDRASLYNLANKANLCTVFNSMFFPPPPKKKKNELYTKLALFVRSLFPYLLPASCDVYSSANYATFNMNIHMQTRGL